MEIQSSTVASAFGPPPEAPPVETAEVQTVEAQPESTQSSPEEAEGQDQDSARGVLRLLEQGHFKGVADVRLRINFAEQLAQRQTAATRQAGDEALTNLADLADSSITSLLDQPELSAEQQQAASDSHDALAAGIDAARQSLGDDGPIDASTILDAVSAALNTFLADLNALFEAPPDESPDDSETPAVDAGAIEAPAAAPDEPASAEAPSIDALLADLDAAFADASARLADALTSTSLLPPLSAPTGNGGAYAKFVAIYEQMQQSASPADPADQEADPGIDTSA